MKVTTASQFDQNKKVSTWLGYELYANWYPVACFAYLSRYQEMGTS